MIVALGLEFACRRRLDMGIMVLALDRCHLARSGASSPHGSVHLLLNLEAEISCHGFAGGNRHLSNLSSISFLPGGQRVGAWRYIV